MRRPLLQWIPGRTCLAWLAIGGLFWLPTSMLGTTGMGLGAGFLLVWGLQTLRAARSIPPASSIRIERRKPVRFLCGRTMPIDLVIENHSRKPVHLVLRDEVPDSFDLKTPFEPVAVNPYQSVTVRYDVQPTRRGLQSFNRVVARVGPPGSWIMRETYWDLREEVKVYPDFQLIAEERLTARMLLKDWHVKKPRRQRGEGHEFESLRPYCTGDDTRHVDWKASARRQKLIVRQLQVERGQQIAILLDCGRLMGETIAGATRLDHAMNAALMLGQIAGKRGDNLSLVCFSNQIQAYMPSVKGRGVMQRMMETLYHVEASEVESDYWQVTAEAMHLLKRRSLIVFFTDVLDAAGSVGLANNLRRAASKHLVLCVVLSEPGLLKAARQMPEHSHQVYEKAAASQLLIKRHMALEKMRDKGIMVLECSPDALTVNLIRRYIEIRMGNLQ